MSNNVLRRLAIILSGLTLGLNAPATFAASERVADFALLDEEGKFHQLSRHQHLDAVVLLAYDNNCAASIEAAAKLNDLQSKFGDDMQFFALDINSTDRATEQGWNLSFPVLADELKLVTESLEISQSGEVLVFNP